MNASGNQRAGSDHVCTPLFSPVIPIGTNTRRHQAYTGDTLWHTGDGTDVRFSALTIGLILEHLCARVRDAGRHCPSTTRGRYRLSRMGPSGAYLEFHVPDSITVPLVFVRTVSCVCRTGCNGGGRRRRHRRMLLYYYYRRRGWYMAAGAAEELRKKDLVRRRMRLYAAPSIR